MFYVQFKLVLIVLLHWLGSSIIVCMRAGIMWVLWYPVISVLIFCIFLNDCSSSQLQNLKPLHLWRHFNEISSIPRPSKHEQRVLNYIKNIGLNLGLPVSSDAKGNLLVKCPGINGGEGAKPILIQSHVDMVTEKNEDTVHDFLVIRYQLL